MDWNSLLQNKKMLEKHIDQLSLPKARWSQCETRLKKKKNEKKRKKKKKERKHENKEQGKTEHESPYSKNHEATQNTNYTRTAA